MNSYRRSNGLSSSDIIALAVGIPTGVLTFIGVLLAYLGYRRRRILNANTRRRTPNSFQPEADETNSTHIDKDSDSEHVRYPTTEAAAPGAKAGSVIIGTLSGNVNSMNGVTNSYNLQQV
ncbi:uncharacterized protein ALTATR162_LOCUS8392 [Alternaria atra]|uniref:Uncharacterized protein n=1 Tax=Alternaria atra TaxID=119953 RepID=A0A8J2N890_9PLEO|nr:uncharacterized protein ALTATR162_LOCUS8392 [Alternaria atra]CAG5177816.1 unnamed protein product [Alternaria atra]